MDSNSERQEEDQEHDINAGKDGDIVEGSDIESRDWMNEPRMEPEGRIDDGALVEGLSDTSRIASVGEASLDDGLERELDETSAPRLPTVDAGETDKTSSISPVMRNEEAQELEESKGDEVVRDQKSGEDTESGEAFDQQNVLSADSPGDPVPANGDGDDKKKNPQGLGAEGEGSDIVTNSKTSAGEGGGEKESDLEIQVIKLDELPSSSDDGVRYNVGIIQEKLNIKHVTACLRLSADFLRIATNVLAMDVTVFLRVQELQFELIKMCDAVSLMLQSDQSGANNILEKLKIAYLYLLDGYPEFAKNDIEAISQDVRMMNEATQKCLENIRKVRSTRSETVLKMLKNQLDEREQVVASWVKEIQRKKETRRTTKTKKRKETRHVIPEQASQGHERKGKAGWIFPGTVLGTIGTVAGIYLAWKRISKGHLNLKEKSVFVGAGVFISLGLISISRYFSPSKSVEGDHKPVDSDSNAETDDDLEPGPDQGELVTAVDSIYNARLAKVTIEKSLPLLDDMCVALTWASKLVDQWYTECKEIVEPNMQSNIDRAEGLSAEDRSRYWDSLFFRREVKGYYERWRGLQVHCEGSRPLLKKTRERAETYYRENLRPREAITKAWELAGQETDDQIKALVTEREQKLAEVRMKVIVASFSI